MNFIWIKFHVYAPQKSIKCLISDAYEEVSEGHMTEWEKEREKEEFIRAAKMYKPLAGMIASRFTRAKFEDSVETVDVPREEGVKDYANSTVISLSKINISSHLPFLIETLGNRTFSKLLPITKEELYMKVVKLY